MLRKTSRQWLDSYLSWGGSIIIYDADGWDRKNWRKSWFKERITAEEFMERAARSTLMTVREPRADLPSGVWDDLSYYFQCVVREDNDSESC